MHFLSNPFLPFFQKPLFTRRIADRQIAVIHDLIPQKYPEQFPIGLRGSLMNIWSRWVLNTHIDHIITDSEASKNDISTVLLKSPEHISVLYPTLARSFWREEGIQTTATGNYCIYVGDGTWNKNLVVLARAIQKADVTCMFVGKIFEDPNPDHYRDPWQTEIHDFFQIAQFDKRFIFAGFVTDQQLFRLYQQARVNLLISRDEGFGFSFVEAGALRCPSILADRSIFHEIAGDAALFADPNSIDAVAQSIQHMFSDSEIRQVYSVKAYEQSQKYNTVIFKKNLVNTVFSTGYGPKK